MPEALKSWLEGRYASALTAAEAWGIMKWFDSTPDADLEVIALLGDRLLDTEYGRLFRRRYVCDPDLEVKGSS